MRAKSVGDSSSLAESYQTTSQLVYHHHHPVSGSNLSSGNRERNNSRWQQPWLPQITPPPPPPPPKQHLQQQLNAFPCPPAIPSPSPPRKKPKCETSTINVFEDIVQPRSNVCFHFHPSRPPYTPHIYTCVHTCQIHQNHGTKINTFLVSI